MGTHSMEIKCKNCGGEFGMKMEFYNRETLKEVAEKTECPHCGGKDWYMTDACER